MEKSDSPLRHNSEKHNKDQIIDKKIEDPEIENSKFEWLNELFHSKDLNLLNNEETQKEIQIALKHNKRHYELLKENEGYYCQFFMKTGACKYGKKIFKRIYLIS